MKQGLLIIQVILSLVLVAIILLQSKGSGFARAWKGSGASFTRRGLEKIIYRATFVLSALFILVSILQLTL